MVCPPPPPHQNPGYAYGYNGYLPPVTVTSDVISQFYVRLFFGLKLVLVMIRGVLSVGYEYDQPMSKTNFNCP